jgi:hypothetical protein
MPNRTAKFVSALFASFLAGAPVMATSDNTARAADDCLAGPKAQTPEGGHWYYRIDHSTRRHCWYLGDEHEKLSQTAAPGTASPKPTAPNAETTMQNSVADAHAELAPQIRIDQPGFVAAPALATAVDTAATPSLLSQRSIVATRWPQSSSAGPSADPAPPPVDSSAAAPPTSQAPPAYQATPPAMTAAAAVTTAAPAPAATAVTLAAADAPPEKQSLSIQMLLVVILGALPLAGVMASMIFRFGRTRKAGRRDVRTNRREIWGSIDADHAPPWASPNAKQARRSVEREQDTADDPSARIEKMLAQLSKNARA